jgi:hypothetical protein
VSATGQCENNSASQQSVRGGIFLVATYSSYNQDTEEYRPKYIVVSLLVVANEAHRYNIIWDVAGGNPPIHQTVTANVLQYGRINIGPRLSSLD